MALRFFVYRKESFFAEHESAAATDGGGASFVLYTCDGKPYSGVRGDRQVSTEIQLNSDVRSKIDIKHIRLKQTFNKFTYRFTENHRKILHSEPDSKNNFKALRLTV